MQCMSCDSEIDPKWAHAVEQNICPFCGKNIMEEVLKDLLYSLREIFEKIAVEGYSSQLDDWILSNFGFIKTNAENLIQYIDPELIKGSLKKVNKEPSFTVKVQTEEGEEVVVAQRMQTSETTNEFFKRAEAIKPGIDGFKSPAEKTEHLKALAKQIKKAGGKFEALKTVDLESINEMEGLLSSTDEVASSLSSNNDDDEIPAIVQAMASNAQGTVTSKNTQDLLKLQQMQDRQRASRKNFENGGVKGGFSRSG